MSRLRITLTLALAATLATACVSGEDATGQPATENAGGQQTELRLDYAYYNPSSLVIRDQKWLETELAAKNVKVTWTLSAGSNKANENLRGNVIDLGSTAGAAAFQARSNGTPIKAVGIFSQPEWAAVVVAKDSPITDVAGLKGKRVAATKGTDPYFFLLQSLHEAGLAATDVEVVNLQHADGKTALERGDVDAWAGLDPLMAQSQIDGGSKLIYRNAGFNSYGFLNAREAFITEHPDLVQATINAYEKARDWIQKNPDAAVALLSKESKVSPEVAKLVLTERTNLAVSPVPGADQRAVLERILPTLVEEKQVKTEQDATTALDSLFEPKFAEQAAKQ
ncbi:aliphatic sulfonate ABC transporter substrate-binding protein [Herbidospora sp. NEAU-GS84]|uniref:Putative aliphatic sulfonates-binding protein n=1 Tax=Herbidospora solisilvae TaxID=2696284 RepID=A0A7C9NBB9_9ACTN|nr:aliphatic sulfonate ABC transporter substrate-binding protein [Herbidospora solisilvae]NAS20255.1 aliphatic sulfonate ABC transporter substrate-binding protein [Herbidospora solisilvae]